MTKKKMTPDDTQDEICLRFLPSDLLFSYEVLVLRGLSFGDRSGFDESVDPSVGKVSTGRTSTGQTEQTIRTGSGAGKYGSGKKVVRSEAAIEYRKKVDRRLRKLAKEISRFLEDEETKPVGTKKCPSPRCGLFGEYGWTYCPSCGTLLQERQIR